MRTLAVVAILVGLSVHARAEEPASTPPDVSAVAPVDEDHAKADALFMEAQALKAAGNLEAACKTYEQALHYNRNAVGTLLNVGKCNEDAGKFATALAHYTQARDLAREHQLEEHRRAAEEAIAKVAPRVGRLAIAFTERPANMKLVIDDQVYSTNVEVTNELRLDPGERHIVVSAPGRVTFEATVTLEEGKLQALPVPKLGYPVTVKSTRRTAGKIVTFSGVGLLATGVVMGYLANRSYDAAFESGLCMRTDSAAQCEPEGFAKTESARQLGHIGTAVGLVGVAAVGIGAYLWLSAPRTERSDGVAVVPTLGTESAGLAAVGRF